MPRPPTPPHHGLGDAETQPAPNGRTLILQSLRKVGLRPDPALCSVSPTHTELRGLEACRPCPITSVAGTAACGLLPGSMELGWHGAAGVLGQPGLPSCLPPAVPWLGEKKVPLTSSCLSCPGQGVSSYGVSGAVSCKTQPSPAPSSSSPAPSFLHALHHLPLPRVAYHRPSPLNKPHSSLSQSLPHHHQQGWDIGEKVGK